MRQIFHDYKVLHADHVLNKGFGKSGLQTALELGLLAFGIKLLLQIVAFEGILVSVVPFRALPPMLFPLAFRITTGSLAMFEPWMGREPAPTNTARTFFCVSLTAHGFPLFG
ncbi:MAG: hypothetical protein K9N10_13080 [Deltaproteobacteria bacterium]|nr:hypothetical protein [Deltaproteobacteria bacterium]